jgi:FkbM family methyltransferase
MQSGEPPLPEEDPAPGPLAHLARRAGHALPDMPLRKPLASIALRLAGGKTGRSFEVTLFGTERARLHPADNISEKRVFITPQFWEPGERAALSARIATHGGHDFVFLDVGGNAGLYTLFVHSCCRDRGIALKALIVEPDPQMRARLAVNLRLSGIDAQIFPCTAADAPGRLTLSLHPKNRGENSLVSGGDGIEVEVRTLASMLAEAGVRRVDAMKMDIEGAEEMALRGLFEATPEAPRPAYVQIEGVKGGRNAEAIAYLETRGYALLGATAGNSFLSHGGVA